MITRSYGQVKAELARVCGSAGVSTNSAVTMRYTNSAIEELMNEVDIPSLVDVYRFRVTGGSITLPAKYDRVISMKVDDVPQTMQSPWFEFIGTGLACVDSHFGTLTSPGQAGCLDQGEVCTYLDIPDPAEGVNYTLKLVATTDESDGGNYPLLTIQGYDANGDWVRTSGGDGFIDGQEYQFSGVSPLSAVSDQTFSRITQVIKPVTRKAILCYYTPEGGGAFTQIARWEADETNPSYRRYSIPDLNEDTEYTVVARCYRRFESITGDEDRILVPNLPALKNMVQAVYFAEASEPDKYAAHKAIAVDLLKKEVKRYIGHQRQKPFMTMGGAGFAAPGGPYVQ